MSKKYSSVVLKNPFSDNFTPTWEIWKQYKKEEFGFQYRGLISEQAALNELVRLADEDEQKAIDIITQSLSHGWQGFWPLKKPSPNGKSNKQPKGEKSREQYRSEVQAELDKRNGIRGQAGDELGLKAV